MENLVLRLDYVARTLVNIDSGSSEVDEVVQLLGETISHLDRINSASPASSVDLQAVPQEHSGNRGRPSFEIKEEQLFCLSIKVFKCLSSLNYYRYLCAPSREG